MRTALQTIGAMSLVKVRRGCAEADGAQRPQGDREAGEWQPDGASAGTACG